MIGLRTPKNRDRGDAQPLVPEIQAELDALDAALRGEPIGDQQLTAMVRDVQASAPVMPSAAREQLSERFGTLGGARSQGSRPKRRARVALAGAGGLATVLVAVVVAVSVFDGFSQSYTLDAGTDGSADVAAVVDEAGDSGATLQSFDAPAAATARKPHADAATESLRSERAVERSAALTVTVPQGEIAELPRAVESIARDAGGYVDESRLSVESPPEPGDQAGSGGHGTFTLRVRTAELDQALSALGDLGVVTSQQRGSTDITATVDSAKRRLSDAQAERRALLKALGQATTAGEIAALRARIEDNRTRRSTLQREVDRVQRRASMSTITLTVTAGDVAAISDDGRWGIDDALADAGRALTVMAGVLLIAGAVLAPLALLAGVGAAVVRARRRRLRNDALGD